MYDIEAKELKGFKNSQSFINTAILP